MYHISDSIEICSPPEKVLAFVCNAEERMRLNPSCTVISCEQLNSREAGGGARFRFFLHANGRRFKCEVLHFVEKNRIISRAVDGSACVRLSVKPTPKGTTRLLHEEDFVLPENVLEPRTRMGDSDSFILFRQFLRTFYGFDYFKAEKEKKADEIVANMKQALRTWLTRIREKIEVETGTAGMKRN